MPKSAPSVSFIIPCYNSSEALRLNIEYLISNLKKSNISFEIIIIDDGSLGKEKEITKSIAFENDLKYFYLPKNKGKGAALRFGFREAIGEIIFFTDSDIPYEFDSIEKSFYAIKHQGIDIAMGDRSLSRERYGAKVGFKRSFFSQLYTYATIPLLGKKIDTQVGLKAFRANIGKTLFEKTKTNRFAIDTEIALVAIFMNLQICFVPVDLRSQDGKSVDVFKDGVIMLLDLVRILFYKIFKFYS